MHLSNEMLRTYHRKQKKLLIASIYFFDYSKTLSPWKCDDSINDRSLRIWWKIFFRFFIYSFYIIRCRQAFTRIVFVKPNSLTLNELVQNHKKFVIHYFEIMTLKSYSATNVLSSAAIILHVITCASYTCIKRWRRRRMK